MVCPKNGKTCSGKCDEICHTNVVTDITMPIQSLKFQLQDTSEWYRPVTKKEVFEILDMIGDKSYRYIAGNTGQG